jgi:hypothetical protein
MNVNEAMRERFEASVSRFDHANQLRRELSTVIQPYAQLVLAMNGEVRIIRFRMPKDQFARMVTIQMELNAIYDEGRNVPKWPWAWQPSIYGVPVVEAE